MQYWLTVITPVYNGAAFLEQCLQNVLDQKCAGVEHLVINAGSEDGTAALLERLSSLNPQLRWVTVPHEGIAASLNRGHDLAKGRVIGVLNVDDWYEPGVLAHVRPIFETLPEPGMVVGNCNVRDEKKHVRWLNRPMRLKITDLLIRDPNNPFFPVNPSAYFYHRSLLDRIGPFDESLRITMDVDFIYRAVRVANVVYVNETWGNFWMHSNSATVKDMKAGTATATYRALLRRHRKLLGPRERIAVEMKSIAAYPGVIERGLRRFLGKL